MRQALLEARMSLRRFASREEYMAYLKEGLPDARPRLGIDPDGG